MATRYVTLRRTNQPAHQHLHHREGSFRRITNLLKPLIFLSVGIVAIALVAGIGYYHSTRTSDLQHDRMETLVSSEEDELRLHIFESISHESILKYIEHLTREMHVAGTKENRDTSRYIHQVWKRMGLDHVGYSYYDKVLLSYPDYKRPNSVRRVHHDGSVVYECSGVSPVIIESEQNYPHAGVLWNAYSGTGTASGQPVYVNFGTPEDFEYLSSTGVDVRGKIAIMRYGKLWRGGKVYEAQKRGAVGVLLYPDPKDFAHSYPKGASYPKNIWMPPNGSQRGSLFMSHGDPLTPGMPAKNYTYRALNESHLREMQHIPSIPVQPISYHDALNMIRGMRGPIGPESWRGSLSVSYKLGPGYDLAGDLVTMHVRTHTARRNIRNVFGVIQGAIEPDRYVLLGNHFDAWVYGSLDPHSGTAIMLELSRVLMQLVKTGIWRPRRSIMFCAWDAEEYGLIGSTEWVEEHLHMLQARAIAYLNVDTAVQGNETLTADGLPLLHQLAAEVAALVPNPDNDEFSKGRKTLYDTWILKQPGNYSYAPRIPKIPAPGFGSDHGSFVQFAGIPIMDQSFKNTTMAYMTYPLYHTLYETKTANRLADPDDLKYHVAMTKYLGEMTRSLADSAIIPFNVTIYARTIQHILKNTAVPMLKNASIDATGQLNNLFTAVGKLTDTAVELDTLAGSLRYKTPTPEISQLTARVNERMQKMEQCFLYPAGARIPGRPPSNVLFRHMIFGENPHNSYAGSGVPGLAYAVSQYEKQGTFNKREALSNVLEQLSFIQYGVEAATQLLKIDVI